MYVFILTASIFCYSILNNIESYFFHSIFSHVTLNCSFNCILFKQSKKLTSPTKLINIANVHNDNNIWRIIFQLKECLLLYKSFLKMLTFIIITQTMHRIRHFYTEKYYLKYSSLIATGIYLPFFCIFIVRNVLIKVTKRIIFFWIM